MYPPGSAPSTIPAFAPDSARTAPPLALDGLASTALSLALDGLASTAPPLAPQGGAAPELECATADPLPTFAAASFAVPLVDGVTDPAWAPAGGPPLRVVAPAGGPTFRVFAADGGGSFASRGDPSSTSISSSEAPVDMASTRIRSGAAPA
ncbi:hypothetical protein OV079_47420 [Nannocystis pusilla]|uniref:Uncharacterized protein n=1 Tax=Nannocystis pusilla TaxID=889268 RepID=A0A9X3F0H7_9BACT|nr:hypothetical protein [Nannocystis pusilla]MCY1013040.1 hypothetical protein [Nannocystis pusilla]